MNVDIPNDITTSSFNWIFNYIYNTLLSIQEAVPDIYFEFKPIGYNESGRLFSLRISPYLVRDFIGADSPIITLIHSIYWFIISYFILNSIRKYIERVKSGDIMTHTDTNIKSEML